MRERVLFDPFVLPFLLGMTFVLSYCLIGCIRITMQLCPQDRRKFLLSLITPKTLLKNIRDIFLNCLLHVKLWKRNPLLGYMHSSIAFGWFMLIVLGHIEVMLFIPERVKFFYFPIFFNFFVAQADATLPGKALFFLMDFFLLVVLSGIALAMVKRLHSRLFGMRRTTRLSFLDRIGLYSLWAIFPLRLLAEGFTAHISGGSFLTIPLNWIARQFLGNELNMLPTWWAYSIALCIFLCVLPFTRYMHIPAEMMLIPMRNAGLQIRGARKGFARAQVISCPGCGVCIDACPMSADKRNLKDCTVYLNRQIRRGNEKRIQEISDKCLMCGKCKEMCQVSADGPGLRQAERELRNYKIKGDYSRVQAPDPVVMSTKTGRSEKVLYFAGCMTGLTPAISNSVKSVLTKAGVGWEWMDKEGGMCCGRPLMTAGRSGEARQLIEKNSQIINGSGANILLLSCPICYRIFKEEYSLPGIRVLHHSEYFAELIKEDALKIEKQHICYAYHDPCDLGRGCGVYEAPRKVIGRCASFVEAEKNHSQSVCCGGSLGSLSLSFEDRRSITEASLRNLTVANPDAIATACPLCLTSFSRYSKRPVMDLAEIVDKSSL